MNVNFISMFFFIFLWDYALSQPIEPTTDYKYILRIQREVEAKVGYYLDEPKTGDLKKVHFESTNYLFASEKNPKDENLVKYSEKVKSAVGQLIRKKYNPNILNPKKRNIRYHYFYIDESSRD